MHFPNLVAVLVSFEPGVLKALRSSGDAKASALQLTHIDGCEANGGRTMSSPRRRGTFRYLTIGGVL